MLNIEKKQDGSNLDIKVSGKLNTTTSPELEQSINESIDGVTALTFDFAELSYISSAGLRVLLSAQKKMNKQGSMVVKNCTSEILEIFEVTGFSDILTIE
ncbi:MAG: STAS domain-containing protein [Eubacterium sp.]|nr:STAS domain-containing protein [Eubacterium sp.]MCR5292671.1 STAS domain-containing protein [Eubacterium sp.]